MIDDDDIKENSAEETSGGADAASEATPAPDAASEASKEADKPAESGVKEYTPESFDEKKSTEEEKKEEEDDDDDDDDDDDEPKEKTITVQPVQFASFEEMEQVQGPQNQNLNILLDVKLQLSVELGKTDLPIKKVLELTKGSIVTLNKAAGEPVELYANGKLIAYGEVVVIEDNFGLRITHITDPVRRLNTINSAHKEDF